MLMIDDAKLLLEQILIQQEERQKPEEIADATPAPIKNFIRRFISK